MSNNLAQVMFLCQQLKDLPPGTYSFDELYAIFSQNHRLKNLTHEKFRWLIYHPAMNVDLHRADGNFEITS